MAALPHDPIGYGGLSQFYHDFRSGKTSSEQATKAYLDRIEQLNPCLQAYQYVNSHAALQTAQAMDQLLAAGVDLGPLMGVPIAIKDVFTINQMPAPQAGSHLPVAQLAGDREGSFIRALRHLGCVFLGQTKTVELCLGITGVSAPLGTPWNPWDANEHRVPGGSSSGSSVAVSAGLCALAIGSDSGGSVRVPAAFNGIFGLKTTFNYWPTDGTVPLDPRVDSIGLLTHSALDAQIAFHAISAQLFGHDYDPTVPHIELNRLRFGSPSRYFEEGLAAHTKAALSEAQELLINQGVVFDPVSMPEASEREGYFPLSMPASLIAALGPDTIKAGAQSMDPIVKARVDTGHNVSAAAFLAAEAKRQKSIQQVKKRFHGFDAWVSATTLDAAPTLKEFNDPEKAMQLALGMTRNTQPGNYLELCAISMPLPFSPHLKLPLGYQLMASAGNDAKLLAIAVEIENLFGPTEKPDIHAFIKK